MSRNYRDMIGQNLPPPASLFSVQDIPDLSGKVIIVTGGTSGLGKETARVLLTNSAKVYIASRNEEKAKEAIEDLKWLTGGEALFLKLDLADLRSVKAAAEEFTSKETRLDILYNNAGIMMPPIDDLTVDGHDLQFGTNILGPFYFTKLLLPILLSTAKSNRNRKARVVSVASAMHLLDEGNFGLANDSIERRRTGTPLLYAMSKFATVVFARELAWRYGAQGLVAASVHPGMSRTGIYRNLKGVKGVAYNIAENLLYEPSQGALTQLYAGTSDDLDAAVMNGNYFVPWARVGSPHPGTQDPRKGEELWTFLEEQIVKFEADSPESVTVLQSPLRRLQRRFVRQLVSVGV